MKKNGAMECGYVTETGAQVIQEVDRLWKGHKQARMGLRNPEHQRERNAHYEAIGAVRAGMKDLEVLELMGDGIIPEEYCRKPVYVAQMIDLLSSVGPHATKSFGERIPDQALEEYRDLMKRELPNAKVTEEGVILADYVTLWAKRTFVQNVMAPLAAIQLAMKLEELLKTSLTVTERECCRDLLGVIKGQFAEYLGKPEKQGYLEYWKERLRTELVGKMIPPKGYQELKTLVGSGNTDQNLTDELLDDEMRQYAECLAVVGSRSTKLLSEVISDEAIEVFVDAEGRPLPGIYFCNDGETVQFVGSPSMEERKNYIRYVLAPLAAAKLMKGLQSFSQERKDKFSAEEREDFRKSFMMLRRDFGEYFHARVDYIENLQSWKERGGKIKKSEIMHVD